MSDFEYYECKCGRWHGVGIECAIGKRSRQQVGMPTREMKLKALSDIRAWSSVAAHEKDGQYSDLVEERCEAGGQPEAWRKAYDWVDEILSNAELKLRRHTDPDPMKLELKNP